MQASLQSLTGSTLDENIIDSAWKQVDFTADPLPSTLVSSAQHAVDVGLLDQARDRRRGRAARRPRTTSTLVNKVLTKAGRPEVKQ
ncbi:MAG: hypothetical protein V9G10_14105 [Candidatus Nanopelagicales bacterium]